MMGDTLDMFAQAPDPPAPAAPAAVLEHVPFAWWGSAQQQGREVAACAKCNAALRRPIDGGDATEEYGTGGWGAVRPCPGRNPLNPWGNA